jgi:prepilin-type N-terminal cleavage/methylation domain-containing protein
MTQTGPLYCASAPQTHVERAHSDTDAASRMNLRPLRLAFTLIELLIVVAMIAILAAIAVPNFLEAQARAKVSRELNDMRTLATALEAYRADNNAYPPHGELLAGGTINFPPVAGGLTTLEFVPMLITTPIAYVTTLPQDPFYAHVSSPYPDLARRYGYMESVAMAQIQYNAGRIESGNAIMPRYGGWRLYAAGPDGDRGGDAKVSMLYDPTNGTVSDGDILRSQRFTRETLSADER